MHVSRQERMESFDQKHYVRPHLAYSKMKLAEESGKTVWLYGATSYGKTSFINSYFGNRHITYFSANQLQEADLITSEELRGTIVIDDLQTLLCPDICQDIWKAIEKLVMKEDAWLILISRGKIPKWLHGTFIKHPFTVIEEKDLELSDAEIEKLIQKWEVHLTKEQVTALSVSALHNAYFISLTLAHLSKGEEYKTSLLKVVQQQFWDYLELHVYEQWEPQMQDFLLRLSIVERFTVPMARMITGKNDAEYLLRQAMEIGNFLIEHVEGGICENDPASVSYEMRRTLLLSLRRWMYKKYDEERIRTLYCNAGLYYEMNNEPLRALEMYQKGQANDRMLCLLVENARIDPGSGHYFELRKFYLALPREDIRKNPDLMCGMSMLNSLLLDQEESEYWYGELKAFAQQQTGSLLRYTKSLILYLDIGLPHRGTFDLIEIIKHAGTLLECRKVVLPEFSVTSNLPSMMNGGKDFCEWSKSDVQLARSIGKVVSFVLGKYGKGLVNLALAESFFEKGADRYEVAALLANGRMQADSGGKLEQVFVADGLMAWQSVFDGKLTFAKDRLESFYKKAEAEREEKLIPNIETFLVRLELYSGNIAVALRWMESAPDENVEFISIYRFHYLTKVRIYLCTGKYELAVDLLQKLLYYAEVMKRTFVRMECELLLAITQQRMGYDGWDETLQRCLDEAQEYHFVRLVTREAGAAYKLLKMTAWKPQDKTFYKELLEEAGRMEKLYPAYLKTGAKEVVLGENALAILKLQAEGFSVAQIAKRLHIQEGTVKYHSSQTYQKLGVKDKSGAVAEAYRRGLI